MSIDSKLLWSVEAGTGFLILQYLPWRWIRFLSQTLSLPRWRDPKPFATCHPEVELTLYQESQHGLLLFLVFFCFFFFFFGFFFCFFFFAVLSRSHVDFFLFNCLNFLTNAYNVLHWFWWYKIRPHLNYRFHKIIDWICHFRPMNVWSFRG